MKKSNRHIIIFVDEETETIEIFTYEGEGEPFFIGRSKLKEEIDEGKGKKVLH